MVTLEEGSVCFRLKMVYLIYVLLDSYICVSNDCPVVSFMLKL